MYSDLIDFIKDLYGSERIGLHEPSFSGNEKAYLNQCIDSTFVSSVGKFVDDAEQQLSSITGANKAIATVNGTSALQVALRLAGVSEGDEVITQGLSFVATANAIVYNGAYPVFLDVDAETLGLSADALNSFLDEFAEERDGVTVNKVTHRRIACCVPMHTFGLMCDMDKIAGVCERWNIPIVEDAAEALGSSYKGRHAGTMGLSGALSFNGNKIITAGGGGAILTNDKELAGQAKHLTTTAKLPHNWEYVHDKIGYNFRMPNINAALLCAQLERLDDIIARKRVVHQAYASFFEGRSEEMVFPTADSTWNYWLITVKCQDDKQRTQLLQSTNDSGVMTRPVWRLLWQLPPYVNAYHDDQVNALDLQERLVNLPSSPIP